MDCKTFQEQITNFINGTMEDDVLIRDFIEHAYSCGDCYEELELYYMLKYSLDYIDNDTVQSFDFTGNLKKLLADSYRESLFCIVVQRITKVLVILAEVSVGAVFFYTLLQLV